jgi:hypothetical protein
MHHAVLFPVGSLKVFNALVQELQSESRLALYSSPVDPMPFRDTIGTNGQQ